MTDLNKQAKVSGDKDKGNNDKKKLSYYIVPFIVLAIIVGALLHQFGNYLCTFLNANDNNVEYSVVEHKPLGLKDMYYVTTPTIYGKDSLRMVIADLRESTNKKNIQIQFFEDKTKIGVQSYAFYNGVLDNDELQIHYTAADKAKDMKEEERSIAAEEGNVKIGQWVFHDSMGDFTETLMFDVKSKEFYFRSLLPGANVTARQSFKSVQKKGNRYVFLCKNGELYELTETGVMYWKSEGYPTVSAKDESYQPDLMKKYYE